MPFGWAASLEQQRLDAIRVNRVFERRPGENRKTAILRSNQRNGVDLILSELRRRQVPGAAELRGMDDAGNRSFNRLGIGHVFDPRASVAAS